MQSYTVPDKPVSKQSKTLDGGGEVLPDLTESRETAQTPTSSRENVKEKDSLQTANLITTFRSLA